MKLLSRLFIRLFAIIIFLFNVGTYNTSLAQDPAAGLPLPKPPAGLTDKCEKVRYILTHFWDAIDSIVIKSDDNVILEQTFANYTYLMPLACTDEIKKESINMLVAKSNANPEMQEQLIEIATDYLRNYDSPMRNDALYVEIASAFIDKANLDDTQKSRLEYGKKMASLNLPYTQANDFTFTDINNCLSSLYQNTGTSFTLLLFYDADCNECRGTMNELQNSALVNTLLTDKKLRIVAICIEGDEQDWHNLVSLLPSSWTHGYNDSLYLDNELYEFRGIPSIYILEEDNTVLQRDINIKEALSTLQR